MKCTRCKATAVVALPSHNAAFCPECFLDFFSKQVDKGIREHGLMTKQDKVLVALSGGPAYRFLKRQMRWSGIPISFRIFHSLL